jgi:adenylate cyclase class 2
MYEVELKVRADHESVRKRLEELGGAHRATVEQVDTYYDAPHREFAETDEALRLREETTLEESAKTQSEPVEAHTELTYKGALIDDGTKTREEHETRVEDSEAMVAILQGLGFDPAHVVEKVRHRYNLRGYTVTLDRVRGLDEFVEVEQTVPEEDVAAAREGAIDLLDALGLDSDAGITTSYLGLLLEDDTTE